MTVVENRPPQVAEAPVRLIDLRTAELELGRDVDGVGSRAGDAVVQRGGSTFRVGDRRKQARERPLAVGVQRLLHEPARGAHIPRGVHSE